MLRKRVESPGCHNHRASCPLHAEVRRTYASPADSTRHRPPTQLGTPRACDFSRRSIVHFQRVRVGSIYLYDPVLLDKFARHLTGVRRGSTVRVINVHGCPPANTMGHCYVETLEGEFLGLVCSNSLKPASMK